MRSAALAIMIGLVAATAHAGPDDERAEAAYREGRRHYDLREWDAAIAKFKEAYSLRADAPSLFNIAQAYRLSGDCVAALGFYKTYRRNFPTAKNHAQVAAFIAELEPCAKQRENAALVDKPDQPPGKPEPTPAATPMPTAVPVVVEPARPVAPAPSHPGRALRIAGIAAIAGGAIAGGTSVYFALASRSKSNAVSTGSGAWNPSLEADGKRDARDAKIFAGVGAAAVIAGGVALWLGIRANGEAPPVAVAPVRGGASLVWSCGF